MTIQRINWSFWKTAYLFCAILLLTVNAFGQPQQIAGSRATGNSGTNGNPGRPVTIPLTIRIREEAQEYELQNIDLVISEDGEPQSILSIRGSGTNSPITLAVLIQDDVVSSVETRSSPWPSSSEVCQGVRES